MNKQIEQTLDSREVAEMVGKEHKNLMRDVRSYVEELAALKIEPGTFFKENTYRDANNQSRPCFDITKKGCEFIAHKLTGIKGTEFTARYINRFHDMEETIREGIPKAEKTKRKKDPNRLPLSSANMMVKNVMSVLEKAKVDPIFVAAEVKRLYTDLGYEVKAPLVTDQETMPKLYDCTEIARELGILSKNGKPHNQAVADIIRKLHIEDGEIKRTAFSRNGHDDVTTQYLPSVVDKVQKWLEENGYPTKIPYMDATGNQKMRTVFYKDDEILE